MKGEKQKKPSYASMAFNNPYNYTLLGGVGAVALMTGNWWLALFGAGMEGLWMLFAPDSKVLRKGVWDPQFRQEEKELIEEKLLRLHNSMSYGHDYDQFTLLLATRTNILQLLTKNPSFTESLLLEELDKIDTLLTLYAEMATVSQRYRGYLKQVDLQGIERDIRRLEGQASGPAGGIARKNLEILERRKEKLREITDYLPKAQAQRDLIENTFQLLVDQVVTLRSPQELGGQLDELIDGVEAVSAASRETEKFLQTEAA